METLLDNSDLVEITVKVSRQTAEALQNYSRRLGEDPDQILTILLDNMAAELAKIHGMIFRPN